MLHAGAREGRQEPPRRRLPAFRDVQRKSQTAVGADHGAALHQAIGVRDFPQGLRRAAEHGAPEQHEIVHPPDRQGLRHMVHLSQQRGGRRLGEQPEIVVVDAAARGIRLDQIDQRAVGGPHRRDAPLARTDRLLPFAAQQHRRPPHRARRIVHPQRHGADRGAVELEMLRRRAVLLAVQDQVDPALAEQIDRLRAVPAGIVKAETAQGLTQLAAGFVIDGEFDERDAVEHRRIGQGGDTGLGFHQQQRPQPVARRQPRRRGSEFVVEHFQRQRAAIPRPQHVADEIRDRQLALAREQPEMPAPGQRIHRQNRRVRQLHEKQFLTDRLDARGIIIHGQGMKTIDDQPQCGMTGRLHDLPGVPPSVDVPAPGQRLIADAQAAALRPLRHFRQVGGGARIIVERRRMDTAAHQQQIRP